MHDKADTLMDRLDESIALMMELRTADPVSTKAYDLLKQARAWVAQALADAAGEAGQQPVEKRLAA